MSFEITQIPHNDEGIRLYVERVKAFRLLSLQTSPDAFLSTYARESAFTDDIWYSRLNNPQAITFIALQGGCIVSTITLIGPLPYTPEDLSPLGNPWVSLDGDASVKMTTNSHWRINAMFTLPAARGQGIAKALLEVGKKFGAQQAQAAGKNLVISIAVDQENEVARTLYERCGFVTIKEEVDRSDSRNVLLMKFTPSSS